MWKLQTIPHIRAHSPHNNLNYSFNLNSNDSSNPNTLNSNPNPNLNLKNDHRHHNTGAYPKSSKSAAIYPSMPMSNQHNKPPKYCQYSFSQPDPKQSDNFRKRKSYTEVQKQSTNGRQRQQYLQLDISQIKKVENQTNKFTSEKINMGNQREGQPDNIQESGNIVLTKQAMITMELQQNQQLRLNLFKAQKTIQDLDNMCKLMQDKIVEIFDFKKLNINCNPKASSHQKKGTNSKQQGSTAKKHYKKQNKQNEEWEKTEVKDCQELKQTCRDKKNQNSQDVWKKSYIDLIEYITKYTKDITLLTQEYKELQIKKNNYKKTTKRSKRNEQNLLKVLHESNIKLQKYQKSYKKSLEDLKQRDNKLQQYQIQNKNLKIKVLENLQQIQKLRRQNKINSRDASGFKEVAKTQQFQLQQFKTKCKQLQQKLKNKQKQSQMQKQTENMLKQRISSIEQELAQTKRFNQNVLQEYKKISHKIETSEQKINEKYQAAEHMYEERIKQYQKYISNIKKQRELLVSKQQQKIKSIEQQNKRLSNIKGQQQKQLNNKKIHVMKIEQEVEKIIQKIRVQELQHEGRLQQKQRQIQYLEQLRDIANQKNQQLKTQLEEVRNDMMLIIDQFKIKELEIQKYKSLSSLDQSKQKSREHRRQKSKQQNKYFKKYSQKALKSDKKVQQINTNIKSSKQINMRNWENSQSNQEQQLDPIVSPNSNKTMKTFKMTNNNRNKDNDNNTSKGKRSACKQQHRKEGGKNIRLNQNLKLNKTLNLACSEMYMLNDDINQNYQQQNSNSFGHAHHQQNKSNLHIDRKVGKLKQSITISTPKSISKSMYRSKQKPVYKSKQKQDQKYKDHFMFIGDSSSLSNLKFNNNNNNIYVSKNSNKIPNGKAEVGNMAKNNKNMRGSRNMNGNMDINEDAASKGLVWKKIKKTMQSPSQNSVEISSQEYFINISNNNQSREQMDQSCNNQFINDLHANRNEGHRNLNTVHSQQEQQQHNQEQNKAEFQYFCQLEEQQGNIEKETRQGRKPKNKMNLPQIMICDDDNEQYGQHDISNQDQRLLETPKIWNNTSPMSNLNGQYFAGNKSSNANKQTPYHNPNNSSISFKNTSKDQQSIKNSLNNNMNMFLNRTFGVDLSKSGIVQNLAHGVSIGQSSKMKFNLQAFQNKMNFQQNAKIFLTINKLTLK